LQLLICHDQRWFYFLQETYLENKICSSALIKAGVTSKHGLVPATEVIKKFDREDWSPDIPVWIAAWIEAEGQRPWPSE